MASSSSSRFNTFSGIESEGTRRNVSESSRLYDVFINHRGPDVKESLATELYNSLKEVGIRAFLDSKEKELGESFPSTIETAIKSAKVHIAIFSKRYAESPWCLDELVLMSQSQAKIIPVFYQVQPWELRHIEKGEYAKAFTEYESKKRCLKNLPEWKKALESVSLVCGEEFNGDCKKIIAAVQKEVQKRRCLHVATYPVGLANLVEDFQRLCLNELVQDFEDQCSLGKGKHKAKVVGIYGMGGAGKTTLAKELFNRKISNYTQASFLFDVREVSVTGRLPSLQAKLLKDLFQVHHLDPTSKDEGMSYLNEHLTGCPDLSFLIVVDDIDHVEQLNALMIMEILNKFSNTLIIVTTRDVGVLTRAGITEGYNLEGMDRYNGRELFCWHAFGQSHPSSGYGELVNKFVEVCGGLPLSIQVLGRHVHGKPESFWRSALTQATKTLPQDVKNRLRISFDGLSGEEKQIFIDIACFFIGKLKSIAERVWEGSGWNGQYALEMLKDKCLVEEIYMREFGGLVLRMHDHIRDLGREMTRELSTPVRLWHRRDLESMGLKNILAKNDVRCFHSMKDESGSYQVTFFVGQPEICVERSASLLWLEFQGNHTEQPSIPSWISLQYVQCLKIRRGRLDSTQGLLHLKELEITECPELKELRLEHLGCLEKIEIKNCNHLKSVSGINNLTKLAQLNITECPQLELEELRLEHLGCLEKIAIQNCNHLKKVSGINKLSKLVEVGISDCRELEFECLCLSGMTYLERIIFDGDVKVKYFELNGCQNLKLARYGKDSLGSSRVFGKSLEFDGPVCLVGVKISQCGNFEHLHFNGCQNLKSMSGNFKIEKLEINNCQNLKSVSGNFVSVYIDNCPELEELPCFSGTKNIRIISCGKLQTIMLPTSVSSNFKIKELESNNCQNFKSVSCNFQSVYIDNCPEFDELQCLSSIEKICFRDCGKLHTISDQKLPSLSSFCSSEDFPIESCEKLQNMAGIEEFHVSNYFELSYCGKAIIRSCINKLKNVPMECFVIGRAVAGAESSLNENLFSEADIVTDIVKFGEDTYEKWKGFIAIQCCLVVVDSSTSSLVDISSFLWYVNYNSKWEVREGEWIITMVGRVGVLGMKEFSEILKMYGIMKKGFQIGIRVDNDKEWKSMKVLHTIVDRLYDS